MKLIFHTGKNVGDALNPLIFEHYLGREFFDGKPDEIFLGIGSILGLKGHLEGRKIVFSSGWADDSPTYGPKPEIDSSFDVRAVRGPLTAAALGLPGDLAVVDGAYLIDEVVPRTRPTEPGMVGFIPHHKSLDFFPHWKQICAQAGLEFIDVREAPEDFIHSLWRCGSVLTEAMHGAILADAYRIPWVSIRLYPHINEFKWRDWAASLELDFVSHTAPAKLHPAAFFADLIQSRGIPRWIAPRLSRYVLQRRSHQMVQWLKKMKTHPGSLSEVNLLRSRTGELRRRLLQFKEERQKIGH